MGEHAGLSVDCNMAEIQMHSADHLDLRWHNIVRNLANRNVGRLVWMNLEYELRALDQSRFTVDGVHFDTIEGQA